MCSFRVTMGTLVALGVLGHSIPGFAADMPLKARPKAVVQNYGGYYIWVDGSYQSLDLPSYDLGFPG